MHSALPQWNPVKAMTRWLRLHVAARRHECGQLMRGTALRYIYVDGRVLWCGNMGRIHIDSSESSFPPGIFKNVPQVHIYTLLLMLLAAILYRLFHILLSVSVPHIPKRQIGILMYPMCVNVFCHRVFFFFLSSIEEQMHSVCLYKRCWNMYDD